MNLVQQQTFTECPLFSIKHARPWAVGVKVKNMPSDCEDFTDYEERNLCR